jgi:hypothetical protein
MKLLSVIFSNWQFSDFLRNHQYFELTKIWILINIEGSVVTFCIYFLFERNKTVNWQMKDAQIGNYLGK